MGPKVGTHLVKKKIFFCLFRKDEDPENKIEFKTRLGEYRIFTVVVVHFRSVIGNLMV